MQIEVELQDMGEDAGDEGTVSEWFVEEGDRVDEGEVLVEILSDDVSYELLSPAAGEVIELLADEDDLVRVGDIVAIIEGAEGIPEPGDFFQEEE